LTHAAANDTQPRFSPDGRALLFISDRAGRKQPWILPLDGGEPRLAADIAGDAKVARWSPDGARVLVVAPSGVERLAVGDPDDPTARVIDDFAWRLDNAGFRNQLSSVWLAPLAVVERRRISDPAWEILDARWMPDGRHVVVVADGKPDAAMRRFSEGAAVWQLDVTGDSRPLELASLPGGVAAIRPTAGGERFAIVGKEYPRQPSWADDHLFLVEAGAVRRLGRTSTGRLKT
jgi:dipeptidyl aminopeptidase/acylaminoacyl peptidase